MARTSGQLQHQCQQCGLETNGTREQLMERLAQFYVKRDNLKPLPQIHVMLSQNGKDMLDYTLDKPWRSVQFMKFWNDTQWVVEPKLDGLRVKAHFHPSYAEEQNEIPGLQQHPRLDSRRRSDQDFLFAEQSENFIHLQLNNPPPDTILDGELTPPPGVTKLWNGVMWVEGLQIATSIWNSGRDTSLNLQQYCYPQGQGYWIDGEGRQRGCLLHYHAFDIIRFEGRWLHDEPYSYRRTLLMHIMQDIRAQNPYYHITPSWGVDKGWCEEGELEWETLDGRLGEFELLLEQEGEGVIFKYIHSPYEYGKRSWSWMKLKRFMEVSLFITGSVNATVGKGWEGMIGAFELSAMQGAEPIHVASCSGISMEIRRAASMPDGSLNPEFLNRVVECRFQQMTSRSVRGRHAVLVRFRDDQCPTDCTMDQPGFKPSPSEVMEVQDT